MQTQINFINKNGEGCFTIFREFTSTISFIKEVVEVKKDLHNYGVNWTSVDISIVGIFTYSQKQDLEKVGFEVL